MPDGPHDLAGMERLLEREAACHWPVRHRRKPCRIDDVKSGGMRPAALGDVPAVDRPGQSDVGYQHVGAAVAAALHRFVAVGRLDDFETFVA